MVLVNFAPPVSLIRGMQDRNTGIDSVGENESKSIRCFLGAGRGERVAGR